MSVLSGTVFGAHVLSHIFVCKGKYCSNYAEKRCHYTEFGHLGDQVLEICASLILYVVKNMLENGYNIELRIQLLKPIFGTGFLTLLKHATFAFCCCCCCCCGNHRKSKCKNTDP
jgi:hypothetical protein